MTQTILKIDGMMCGMCEAHVNDTIRKNFAVKKVTSSHTKGETTVISEKPLDKAALEKAIRETGYRPVSCREIPYERRTIYQFFHRKG